MPASVDHFRAVTWAFCTLGDCHTPSIRLRDAPYHQLLVWGGWRRRPRTKGILPTTAWTYSQ